LEIPRTRAKEHIHQAGRPIRRSIAPCGRSSRGLGGFPRNAHKGLCYETLVPGIELPNWLLGARQQIIIPPDIPIVIPAGFWRESSHTVIRSVSGPGFPPEACGNDGVPPCGCAWTIICCLAPFVMRKNRAARGLSGGHHREAPL
jgi:hypothetical protein